MRVTLEHNSKFIATFLVALLGLLEGYSQNRCFIAFHSYSGEAFPDYTNYFYPSCSKIVYLDSQEFEFKRVLCNSDTALCSIKMKMSLDSSWYILSDSGYRLFYDRKQSKYFDVAIGNKRLLVSKDTLNFRRVRQIQMIDIRLIGEQGRTWHFGRFGFNSMDNIVYIKGDLFEFIWEEYLSL
jgi:hypothetical protein